MSFKYCACERHWLSSITRFMFLLSRFYCDDVNQGFYSDVQVSRKLFLGERAFSALFSAYE